MTESEEELKSLLLKVKEERVGLNLNIQKTKIMASGPFSLVQFNHSVLSNSFQPMNCSTPGFPVPYQHPELAQTHVHRVSDPIQPSHPL